MAPSSKVKFNTIQSEKDFPLRLRNARGLRNLTQAALAAGVNQILGEEAVSSAVVSDWERDVSPPNLPKFAAICRALNVSPAWLAMGIGPLDLDTLELHAYVKDGDLDAIEAAMKLSSAELQEILTRARAREASQMRQEVEEAKKKMDELLKRADFDREELDAILKEIGRLSGGESS